MSVLLQQERISGQTTAPRKPQGFVERWKARLHWFWCPLEAEMVWDDTKPREPRLINYRKQCFVVILDDDTQLYHKIQSEDQYFSDDWAMSVAYVHGEAVRKFLQDAGQYGVKIGGVFYPHNRIDNIIPGGVESWSEREDHAYAET